MGPFLKKILAKAFFFVLLPLLLLALYLWSVMALYYSDLEPISLRTAVAIIYGSGILLAIAILRSKKWTILLPLAGFVCVLVYWWQIQPKTEAIYPPETEHVAYAGSEGDHVALHNVRNIDYRTAKDFDVHWETRAYDLDKLQTLDLLVNYWGMELIAHTLLSFGFSDGKYLTFSAEIRREEGESYGMLKGIFKQYELIYIWSDERDLVRLRTNYLGEDVYLYRVNFAPDEIRLLFLDMLERTNELKDHPVFYNTGVQNCTNTLGEHVYNVLPAYKVPFYERRLLTGSIDRRLYEKGWLRATGPFPEQREDSLINDRAKAADQDPRFSEKIRTHLPPAA